MEHQLDFVKLELVLGLVGKFVLDVSQGEKIPQLVYRIHIYSQLSTSLSRK